MVLKASLQAPPPMSAHSGENKGTPAMLHIITLPIQIIIGLLLMAFLVLHFNMAMFWLFFFSLVLLGSVFGTKPTKRQAMQDSNHSSS